MAVRMKKRIPVNGNTLPSVAEIQRASDRGELGEIPLSHEPFTEEEEATAKVVAEFYGKNQLLFHEDEDGEYQYIGRINGADMRVEDGVKLKYNYTDKGGYITLDEDKDPYYLTQIFKNLPYGILQKNRTGVGATTLEIKAERNSIIVMPTKNLAFEKATAHNCLYVGSEIEGQDYEMPSLKEYLDDENVRYKKFIVVADSLEKVIKAIGGRVFFDYFFLVDEIDTYQSDSTFRDSMENVIDYYMWFYKGHRSLVTATLKEFSNPELENEVAMEIRYTSNKKRDVKLIHTNNPNSITAEEIEKLFHSTQDKIVIAYNKVLYIRQVIENLSDECKAECAILCSGVSSQYAGSYYERGIEGRILPKRINFITCTYFTGIDIQEKFHLISVSNVDFLFTLLSPDKLTQIAGRGRKGLSSETIIYNTKKYTGSVKSSPEGYRQYLLEYAGAVRDFVNTAGKIESDYYKLTDQSFLDVRKDIESKSSIYYHKGHKIRIVRENVITGEHQIAYFNIDALYESIKLRKEIYVSPESLFNSLQESCGFRDNRIFYEDREVSNAQQQKNEHITQTFKDIDSNNLLTLIDKLRKLYDSGKLDGNELKAIRRKESRRNRVFMDQFGKLYQYVPFDKLIDDLVAMKCHKKTFRGYCNGIIFWALAEDHLFKLDLKNKFREGVAYTPAQIKKSITLLYKQHFNKEIKSERKYIQILKEFINAKKVSAHKKDYVVLSYIKEGLEDIDPLHEIGAETDLKNIVEFSG